MSYHTHERNLPCYDNAERLARVETQLENIVKKLDWIINHPCELCRNKTTIARINTEMKVVKWIGGVLGAGFIGTLIERLMKGGQ